MSKQMPAMQGRPKIHSFKLLGRLLSYLFHYYKVRLIAVFICIMITAAAGISSSVFLSLVIEQVITPIIKGTPWEEVSSSLFYIIGGMGLMYVIALCASVFYNQTMAVVTQGFLKHVRTDMFNRMQSLPIRYFDTHTHGDIMSTYTNDTDALRQLISMSIPQVYYSIVAALVLFVIMLLYSLWLMFVVLVGVAIMAAVAKYVGSRSAKYFIRQQAVIGKTEGYIEEMMGGQKVIKVFCHEERAKEDFDKINDELCDASDKANAYGNILMPAVMNIGHFAFVLVAIVAGLLVLFKVQNLSVTGWGVLSGAVIASFLNMSRQFSLNIGQVSMQINSVVMGLAGAGRILSSSTSSRKRTKDTSRSSMRRSTKTATSPNARSVRANGHGAIPTRRTAPSLIPSSRAISSCMTWISDTYPKKLSFTTSPSMQNPVRRSPLSVRRAREKRPLPTF